MNRIILVAFAVFSSALACPQCGCGNLAPPTCLQPPSPYEAMAAAMALPVPVPPPPQIPPELYYPLGPILEGCGPPPSPLQIIQAPGVCVPGPETPIIPLPSPCLPPPQIIAHKCVVSKAVVKPQIYQRLVQVPTVARFLKKSYAPILENIAYTAVPQCGVEAPCAPPPPPPCGCLPPPPPCGCCPPPPPPCWLPAPPPCGCC